MEKIKKTIYEEKLTMLKNIVNQFEKKEFKFYFTNKEGQFEPKVKNLSELEEDDKKLITGQTNLFIEDLLDGGEYNGRTN